MIRRSSIVVACISTVVVLCISLPGECFSGYAIGFTQWNEYYHGWPWTFLIRTTNNESFERIGPGIHLPWSIPECWNLFRGKWGLFSPMAFLGDMCVAMGIGIVVGSIVNSVKRRKWRQFTLRGIVIVTVVAASVTAWIGQCIRAFQREAAAIAVIEANGHRVLVAYHGPEWLPRLCGVHPSLFYRAEEIAFRDCNSQQLEIVMRHASELEEVTNVEVHSWSINRLGSTTVTVLRSMRQLRRLDLSLSGVDDSVLLELRQLGQLSEIDLEGTRVSEAGVGLLRSVLPNCSVEWTNE